MAHATQSMRPSDAARERRWQRVQAASGLVFAAFVLVHLVNQWLAVRPVAKSAVASAISTASPPEIPK
jgi:hypothetical protein